MVAYTCNTGSQKAEVEESLEPRRWRLWWAKIVPLHSSQGNKSKTSSQKKKNNNKKNKINNNNNKLEVFSPSIHRCQCKKYIVPIANAASLK